MRGDIFMAEKMYREAVEAYKEGSHDSAVLLNKTGIAYHQMLQLDVAEKYYRLSVKANPHYAEAINNLGTIYFAHKSYRRAVNEYKKALRINPQSASIWSNLGSGYFERKDYKRAAESWQKALALDPEVFENRSTQGVLIQEQTVEERAKYHMFLARTYAMAGMDDHALTVHSQGAGRRLQGEEEDGGRSGVRASEGPSRVQAAAGHGTACSVGGLRSLSIFTILLVLGTFACSRGRQPARGAAGHCAVSRT